MLSPYKQVVTAMQKCQHAKYTMVVDSAIGAEVQSYDDVKNNDCLIYNLVIEINFAESMVGCCGKPPTVTIFCPRNFLGKVCANMYACRLPWIADKQQM
jgi:hypothetical protein